MKRCSQMSNHIELFLSLDFFKQFRNFINFSNVVSFFIEFFICFSLFFPYPIKFINMANETQSTRIHRPAL